ncbi:uncharacterized protein LOC134808641 [Pan troglodytes]|uniref:uncharacterized protein LOC134808641 n=1 Tax=Pan troglodytes TaxID=9598 RepID=UPI00301355D6
MCSQFLPSGGFLVSLASGVKLQPFTLDIKVLQVPTRLRSPAGFTQWIRHRGRRWSCLPVPRPAPALLSPWAVDGTRRRGEGGGARRVGSGAQEPTARRGRDSAPHCLGPAGWRSAQSAGPGKPTPIRNSSWPASAARSPCSRPRLSLHTSRQAEGAGSGLNQPREGPPQRSGGLKGSLSMARADAEAEEAPRASEGCEDCQQAVTSQWGKDVIMNCKQIPPRADLGKISRKT